MTLLSARRAPEQRTELVATLAWTVLGRAIDPTLPASCGVTVELAVRGECSTGGHRRPDDHRGWQVRGRITVLATGNALPEPRLLLDAPFAGAVEAFTGATDRWESTEIRCLGPRPVAIELVLPQSVGSTVEEVPAAPPFYVRTDLFELLGIRGGAYAAPRLVGSGDGRPERVGEER
jgi:hypothetical protein